MFADNRVSANKNFFDIKILSHAFGADDVGYAHAVAGTARYAAAVTRSLSARVDVIRSLGGKA